MSSLMNFLFGSPERFSQTSLKTPGQLQGLEGILNQLQSSSGLTKQAMGYLGQFLDPSSDAFSAFEGPYKQQFEQQTIPGLAERFAGFGAQGGALSSSGFGQALGAAGGNLTTQLAALRAQLGRSAVGDIFGQYNQLANQGLGTQSFAPTYQNATTGLLGNLATGAGTGLGFAFGGPIGGALGGSLTNRLFGAQ